MESNDITSMISKIVQNPEFIGMVNDIRGGEHSAEETSKEMLDKLPDVMAMVSPMLGSTQSDSAKTEPAADAAPAASVKPMLMKPGRYDKARATKLMQALKPYLSHGRAEIIDKCLSVMQISDIVGALGGLEALTKLK